MEQPADPKVAARILVEVTAEGHVKTQFAGPAPLLWAGLKEAELAVTAKVVGDRAAPRSAVQAAPPGWSPPPPRRF